MQSAQPRVPLGPGPSGKEPPSRRGRLRNLLRVGSFRFKSTWAIQNLIYYVARSRATGQTYLVRVQCRCPMPFWGKETDERWDGHSVVTGRLAVFRGPPRETKWSRSPSTTVMVVLLFRTPSLATHVVIDRRLPGHRMSLEDPVGPPAAAPRRFGPTVGRATNHVRLGPKPSGRPGRMPASTTGRFGAQHQAIAQAVSTSIRGLYSRPIGRAPRTRCRSLVLLTIHA